MNPQEELMNALNNAYDVCFATKISLENIIANNEKKEQSDLEHYYKASAYIKWYETIFKKNKVDAALQTKNLNKTKSSYNKKLRFSQELGYKNFTDCLNALGSIEFNNKYKTWLSNLNLVMACP